MELSERFGRKIATAEEAREIMKIGVWYDSVDETLKNLGMPPNRETASAASWSGRPTARRASSIRCPTRIPWPTAWCRRPRSDNDEVR